MGHEKRSPAALAGAHRAGVIKSIAAGFDGTEPSAEPFDWQAACVAYRYRLSPCMARLVCHLAQIGGRLA